MDLIEFLAARLDEEAANERFAAETRGRSPEKPIPLDDLKALIRGEAPSPVTDAKRRIVELHQITVRKLDTTPFDPYTGERNEPEFEVECAVCGWATTDQTSGCDTLRLLALPYADHADYREEWKP